MLLICFLQIVASRSFLYHAPVVSMARSSVLSVEQPGIWSEDAPGDAEFVIFLADQFRDIDFAGEPFVEYECDHHPKPHVVWSASPRGPPSLVVVELGLDDGWFIASNRIDEVITDPSRQLMPGRTRGNPSAIPEQGPFYVGRQGDAATELLPRVTRNRARGNAFRDEVADGFRSRGYEANTEVRKWTPFGDRIIDVEISRNGTVLGGFETKLGGSRYLPSQRAKDFYLRLMERYQVVLLRRPR